MQQENPRIAAAQDAQTFHESHLPQPQDFQANDAGKSRPRSHDESDQKTVQSWPPKARYSDHEAGAGNTLKDICCCREERIDNTSIISRQESCQCPKQKRHCGRQKCKKNRIATAEEKSAQHIAPQGVRSEPMQGIRQFHAMCHIGLKGIVRREPCSENTGKHDREYDERRDQCQKRRSAHHDDLPSRVRGSR